MKYYPEYFNFSKLEFYQEMIDVFTIVAGVYAIIFIVSYFASKVPRQP